MEQHENSATDVKPYLIRAIHEWCSDNGFTPYISVVADAHTRVPREFVKDGQIVLNLGLEATHQLSMGNDIITFQARFGGVAQSLSVPVSNVSAIYSRENGQGMAFEVDLPEATQEDAACVELVTTGGTDGSGNNDSSDSSGKPEAASTNPAPASASKGRAHLTRVK